ncbi:alpha/beta fold hydrolase [Moritella marina]|uniref:alpha/beta fold hydrolase n=1 Tax=Moritella marina TaxID=90736 RepID=UPI003703D593
MSSKYPCVEFDNPYNLTTESQLANRYHDDIAQFWDATLIEDTLQGVDNVTLRYASAVTNITGPAIVLLGGRSESYQKFRELIYDLCQQGYSVYCLDHRGQGMSDRLLKNIHKGHVEHFRDYVTDLKLFIDKVISPTQHSKQYLLCHSMGGAIGSLYLQSYHNDFDAAVLASPMFGINFGQIPRPIANVYSRAMQIVNKIIHTESFYAPGKGDFAHSPFENNQLTHSPLRFDIFRRSYGFYPQTQLGGPTINWLQQSIKACRRAIQYAGDIKTPTLVLQAGGDEVVLAEAQQQFCRALSHEHNPHQPAEPVLIPGAAHELFLETDIFRIPALTVALNYFAKY